MDMPVFGMGIWAWWHFGTWLVMLPCSMHISCLLWVQMVSPPTLVYSFSKHCFSSNSLSYSISISSSLLLPERKEEGKPKEGKG